MSTAGAGYLTQHKGSYMSYSVYLHIFPNGKSYCGITKQDPQRRWLYGRGYDNSPRMKNAIAKYGWNAIEHHIIADGLSREEAGELEKTIIKVLRLTEKEYGYNTALGGEFGAKFSDETKSVMSAKAKERWTSEEYRDNQKQKHTGKVHSESTRLKISESNKGKERTEEQKRHYSEVQKGLKHKPHQVSGETKQKISASKMGKHFGGKGKQPTPILCLETGRVYNNAHEVADEYNGNYISVYNAIKNGKTYKGLHWQYAN